MGTQMNRDAPDKGMNTISKTVTGFFVFFMIVFLIYALTGSVDMKKAELKNLAIINEANTILNRANTAYQNGDEEQALELYKKAATLGSAKAHYYLAYRFVFEEDKNDYHYLQAAKMGHEKSLEEALGTIFYVTNDLRINSPQKALDLYKQAIKYNQSIDLDSVYGLKEMISDIEKCVEAEPFDGNAFLEKFNITKEHDDTYKSLDNPYYLLELAEKAANSDRFGKPNAKLAFNLVCRGLLGGADRESIIKDTYEKWKNSKKPQFNFCEHVSSKWGAWYCENRVEKREEKIIENISYPKVTDHIWNINGADISPRCMEEMWVSMDNYQEYEEQYPESKNFRDYPGQYWGNPIPLTPINASWGEPLSLPKSLALCNKMGPKDTNTIEENSISQSFLNDPESNENTNKGYTLIAEWGAKECSKLVPHFAGNCQSLVFVKLDNSYKYPDIQRNTYAYITDRGKTYIVPVTTEMPLTKVIELIENS